MTIRILLVDDHIMFRQGIRRLLECEPDMEIVAEAGDGLASLSMVGQHNPDVVVMDIGMPVLNGIEATSQIVASSPSTKVIGLSVHNDSRNVAGMMRAGAVGYVPKECSSDDLVRGIRTVIGNRMYISPAITHVLMRDYFNKCGGVNNERLARITDKELQVLRLIAQGKSTREIAASLGVSIKTVETHRRHISEKLKLHTLADLVKFAVRDGIVTADG